MLTDFIYICVGTKSGASCEQGVRNFKIYTSDNMNIVQPPILTLHVVSNPTWSATPRGLQPHVISNPTWSDALCGQQPNVISNPTWSDYGQGAKWYLLHYWHQWIFFPLRGDILLSWNKQVLGGLHGFPPFKQEETVKIKYKVTHNEGLSLVEQYWVLSGEQSEVNGFFDSENLPANIFSGGRFKRNGSLAGIDRRPYERLRKKRWV